MLRGFVYLILTIVAITHRALFLEIADAVHHLEDGRLVRQGEPELLQRSL